MSSFTPINGQATALIQNGLLTPPPTPPPVAVAPAPPTALIQFGLLTPPPSPPPTTPAMLPPPPPTPVIPAPTPAPARARPSASSRPRWRRCDVCGNTFSYKNFADHKKVHLMHGSEGALAHPCKQCKKHPERCYVAIHPEQLNTYSCACCLTSHKACSFKSIKVERWGVWAERHPFLLEKENIPLKEDDSTSDSSMSNSDLSISTSDSSVSTSDSSISTSDSSVSTSDSSVSTSNSSVEETPLHMGRPWEL